MKIQRKNSRKNYKIKTKTAHLGDEEIYVNTGIQKTNLNIIFKMRHKYEGYQDERLLHLPVLLSNTFIETTESRKPEVTDNAVTSGKT